MQRATHPPWLLAVFIALLATPALAQQAHNLTTILGIQVRTQLAE